MDKGLHSDQHVWKLSLPVLSGITPGGYYNAAYYLTHNEGYFIVLSAKKMSRKSSKKNPQPAPLQRLIHSLIRLCSIPDLPPDYLSHTPVQLTLCKGCYLITTEWQGGEISSARVDGERGCRILRAEGRGVAVVMFGSEVPQLERSACSR